MNTMKAHKCPECGGIAAWGPDANVCTFCERKPYIRLVEALPTAQVKRLAKANRVPLGSKPYMAEKLVDFLAAGVA